jgi:hypothetical protein
MSKPERGSLSMIKRPLPNLAPATTPKELEDRLLAAEPQTELPAGGGTALAPEAQPYVPPADVHPQDVHPAIPATRLTPQPGKRKEPVQMVTYRIPASLYDRLFRIAEYNHLNMTDIVVEAIDRHLPNFPQPQ